MDADKLKEAMESYFNRHTIYDLTDLFFSYMSKGLGIAPGSTADGQNPGCDSFFVQVDAKIVVCNYCGTDANHYSDGFCIAMDGSGMWIDVGGKPQERKLVCKTMKGRKIQYSQTEAEAFLHHHAGLIAMMQKSNERKEKNL